MNGLQKQNPSEFSAKNTFKHHLLTRMCETLTNIHFLAHSSSAMERSIENFIFSTNPPFCILGHIIPLNLGNSQKFFTSLYPLLGTVEPISLYTNKIESIRLYRSKKSYTTTGILKRSTKIRFLVPTIRNSAN